MGLSPSLPQLIDKVDVDVRLMGVKVGATERAIARNRAALRDKPVNARYLAGRIADLEQARDREIDYMEQTQQLLEDMRAHQRNLEYTERMGETLAVLASTGVRDPARLLSEYQSRATAIQDARTQMAAHVGAASRDAREKRVQELMGLSQIYELPAATTVAADDDVELRQRLASLKS